MIEGGSKSPIIGIDLCYIEGFLCSIKKKVQKMEILIETQNGMIFKCPKCDALHVEYKNLNFNFKEKDFWKFADYIKNLDGEEWVRRNRSSNFKRKIIIPVGSQIFNVLLNAEELQEFKHLINFEKDTTLFQQTMQVRGLEFTSHLN